MILYQFKWSSYFDRGITSGPCFVYSVAEGIMSAVLDPSSPEPQRGSAVEPLLLAAPRDVALKFLSPGEEQGSGATAGL